MILKYLAASLVATQLCLVPLSSSGHAEPPRDRLRLALMRAVPEKWNMPANFATFQKAIALAAERSAELFITPECWLDGYASAAHESTPERIREIA
jgi:hypothetical protein